MLDTYMKLFDEKKRLSPVDMRKGECLDKYRKNTKKIKF
jgi:hypothetical protein